MQKPPWLKLAEAGMDRDALWQLCLEVAQDKREASLEGPDPEEPSMLVVIVQHNPETLQPLGESRLAMAVVLPSDGVAFHWETVRAFFASAGAVGYIAFVAERLSYRLVVETRDGRTKAWSAARLAGKQLPFVEDTKTGIPALFPMYS